MSGRYKCLECKATFDEPEVRNEIENLDGESGWWEYVYYVCPACHSDEVEENYEYDEEGEN